MATHAEVCLPLTSGLIATAPQVMTSSNLTAIASDQRKTKMKQEALNKALRLPNVPAQALGFPKVPAQVPQLQVCLVFSEARAKLCCMCTVLPRPAPRPPTPPFPESVAKL